VLHGGERLPGTLWVALKHLLGAGGLKDHLADRVRDRIVGLVCHPLALARDSDAVAHSALPLQPCREFAQPAGLVAVPAYAAAREPRYAQQQHGEGVVLPVAPDRFQRRQPGGRADHCRERPTQWRVSAHGVRRGEDEEHERVRVLSPGGPERPVERRREHRDGRERHDRQPTAQRQRQRGQSGKGRAVRAQPVEHDLKLGRGQQHRGQADVLDDARTPSLGGAAMRETHDRDRTGATRPRHRPIAGVRSASGMSANRRSGRSESSGEAMAPRRAIHSLADMSNSITLKRSGILLAGVAAINAIVFSPLGDESFFAIVLLGPIATGIMVGVRHGDTRLAAATWAASGLFWLVLDWIINHEDVAFHAVLALVMAALVALGAAIVRAARRIGSSAQPRAAAGERY
jgi:hypothetical protein